MQIKSNIGFGGDGKNGVPREKPFGVAFVAGGIFGTIKCRVENGDGRCEIPGPLPILRTALPLINRPFYRYGGHFDFYCFE